MKRLVVLAYLLLMGFGLQAAQQAPSQKQIDAAAIAALLHSLANQASKDDHGVDQKISAEGAWQDISALIQKYSKEATVPTVEPKDDTPQEKKPWLVRLFEWFDIGVANRHNPDIQGYHDTEYFKEQYIPAQN